MFNWLKTLFGFESTKNGTSIQSIKLEIARQNQIFTEKIDVLESKSIELDGGIEKTYELGLENQKRLENIEENLEKMIKLGETLLQQNKIKKYPLETE